MRNAKATFKKPTAEDVRQLLDHPADFTVSIYMNTDEVGLEPVKRKAQFQDAEKQVVEQFKQLGAPDRERQRIQDNLRWLYMDDGVWKLQQKSLAFFVAPDFANFFQLPIVVKNIVHVSDVFHIKPLVKVVTEPLNFYVLDLSEETVKMFGGNRYEMKVVKVPEMPDAIEGVVGVETDSRHLQFHTGVDAPHGGEQPASFHGHSYPWIDDKHRYLRRFLQAIDKAVVDFLETKKVPLLLLGTERVVTMYKEITRYPLVLDHTIRDNDKSMSLTMIHEQALAVVEQYYQDQQRKAVESLLRTGDSARFTDNIEEILREAELGRVDMLMVAQGEREWGRFDRMTLTVHHQNTPTAHDLLNTACAVTLLKGGKAYVLPRERMPEQKRAIAVFRY